MSRLGDFSSAMRARMGARSADPDAWTPLRKPLSECTLAVVCGSAYVDVAPQLDAPGVELCGFRAVSDDDPMSATAAAPAAAGQTVCPEADSPDFEADRLGVVVARAHELVAASRIARLNHRHLTLTGAVDSRSRLVQETRRTAVGWLSDDQVDVVLLVPM
jgi:hypothetical protein